MAHIVELDYNDLLNQVNLSNQIKEAFGVDGIGVLSVKNVPLYLDARSKMLPFARKFALLPDDIKQKYVHERSYFSFGWSHGKEKLEGKPDISKGSYYANPQFDRPVDDEDLIEKHLAFIHPNIWPTKEFPEFEVYFKELGQIIVRVGKLVAHQCDLYVKSQCSTYPENKLENIIGTSVCCKARLLHYFPIDSTSKKETLPQENLFSSWCGWHNDHGSLTGLTAAMYIDEATGEQIENKDPTAGLYVRNRRSELIQVKFPIENIGFQIGETAQVHSGGILQATPHAVRGSSIGGISRETFAVFMEPNWDEPMNCPDGIDPSHAQSQTAAQNLPVGVPPLNSRWTPPSIDSNETNIKVQTFGEFTTATHKAYY